MGPAELEVAPERLDRWVAGFVERHGPSSSDTADGRLVRLLGEDGATAALSYFDHDPLGVVLVRRGGYAVGAVRGGRLVASKVGTRYVQSRTAAGGWSQQRFARRRGNQADALVGAVAGHTLAILWAGNRSPRAPGPGGPHGLVVGGDRALVAQVLADSRLRPLAELPRRELYDLPDPRRDVLDRAVARGRSVRIHLVEPSGRGRRP